MLSTVDAVRDRLGEGPVHGLVPGLVVTDPAGWTTGDRFADGSALTGLISAAQRRWGASPHAAAALAWKSYAYWVALPAVLGFATAGRVPDVSAGNVLLRLHVGPPFLEVGLCRPAVAVTPADPLAAGPGVRVVDDLSGYLRETLLDRHLSPVLDGLHGRIHLGRRTLLGSVASGVAHGLVRAESAPRGRWPAAGRCWTRSAWRTSWRSPRSCASSGAPAASRSPCPSRRSAAAAASADRAG